MPNLLDGLAAIHDGHAQIQQHQIVRVRLKQIDGDLAVLGQVQAVGGVSQEEFN